MIRFHSIALCFVLWSAALSASHAEHSGRPANVPDPADGGRFFYIDGDGEIRATEGNSGPSILIFGWSFDPQNPDSPFEASSPSYSRSDIAVGNDANLFSYNGSVLTFDQLNLKALNQNPNFNFGPTEFNTFDSSTLKVTNSIVRSVFAEDSSNVEISNTRAVGVVEMSSEGTMSLRNVTPLSEESSLFVLADQGTLNITSSTVTSLGAIDTGNVIVTGSTINGRVSSASTNPNPTGNPSILLSNTSVGALFASVGSIVMSGDTVDGIVEAIATGKISVTGATVKGNVSAREKSTISLTGSTIVGNVDVGFEPDATATINVSGGSIAGRVQAVARGVINISGVPSVGTTGNIAAAAIWARERSTVTVSGVEVVHGSVFATETSTLLLDSVGRIDGDLIVEGEKTVSLSGTIIGRDLVSRLGATINMSGGRVANVSADGGTITLSGVAVTNTIDASADSHVTFNAGSSTGGDIRNFGDDIGLVSITGGEVAGSLIGFGRSITAMSGGTVFGFPVFRNQATFLFSGGTFLLIGTPPGPEAARLSGLASGAEQDGGEPVLTQLPGFAAYDDAEIKIIGTGLQSTLVDPNFVNGPPSFSVYQLTGRLADGSPIDGGLVYVQNLTNARFQLIEAPVPEPASLALLLVAICASGSRFVRSRRMFPDRGAPR